MTPVKEAQCLCCDKIFLAKKQYGRLAQYSLFCSRKCVNSYSKFEHSCGRCGVLIVGKPRQRYCQNCRQTHVFVCRNCGAEFRSTASVRAFCSNECFHAWELGNINTGPKSEEHRRKISESCKRNGPVGPMPLEQRQKISASRKGIVFSEEHRQHMREAMIKSLEAGKFRGKQSAYISKKTGEVNWAHSKFELELMQEFDDDDDIVRWTKNHGVRVKYLWRGSDHTYVPDFLIEKKEQIPILLEAKGYEYEPERCALKYEAAEKLCNLVGWKYEVVFQHHRKDWQNVKIPQKKEKLRTVV